MADENTVLKGAMKDLGEASRRIRAARHLMREHALEETPRTCGWWRACRRLWT